MFLLEYAFTVSRPHIELGTSEGKLVKVSFSPLSLSIFLQSASSCTPAHYNMAAALCACDLRQIYTQSLISLPNFDIKSFFVTFVLIMRGFIMAYQMHKLEVFAGE